MIICVSGRSGDGINTTCQLLLGELEPKQAAISINGRKLIESGKFSSVVEDLVERYQSFPVVIKYFDYCAKGYFDLWRPLFEKPRKVLMLACNNPFALGEEYQKVIQHHADILYPDKGERLDIIQKNLKGGIGKEQVQRIADMTELETRKNLQLRLQHGAITEDDLLAMAPFQNMDIVEECVQLIKYYLDNLPKLYLEEDSRKDLMLRLESLYALKDRQLANRYLKDR